MFFKSKTHNVCSSGKQGIQYETVSGFVCEAFGYIPKTGESVKVVLEKESWEEDGDEEEGKQERQEPKEKNQIYRVEVLIGSLWYLAQSIVNVLN